MKCPKCGIEMRLQEVKDERRVWVCRNKKCQNREDKQEKEEQQYGAD